MARCRQGHAARLALRERALAAGALRDGWVSHDEESMKCLDDTVFFGTLN